ncbi:MAG: cysteine desulfurase [Actinomycetota bacterium]|nr:cysteine desulfurase [Actinomycetota bacterium]
MLPWFTGDHAADPGRVHTEGRMARAALEAAREQVAQLLGARPREVVFTSGATEAINAAIYGATTGLGEKSRVVASAVEHSAVLEAAGRHELVRVAVDGVGRVEVGALLEAVDDAPTALVSVQWANHEVGTRQPVKQIVEGCRARGVLVHVDAAAAAGYDDIAFDDLGADLLSVSAHKIGGPKGAGALLVRRGLRLPAMIVGGEQERARRGGMENVPALVGFGVAAELALGARNDAGVTARRQTEAVTNAATAVDGVEAFGDQDDRVPHIVCFGIEGVEAEAVLLGLDQAGIAAHSGSACSSESLEPSPVLEAMGVEAERSLRISVGWSTTDEDIDAFAHAFPTVVEKLRALGQSPQ